MKNRIKGSDLAKLVGVKAQYISQLKREGKLNPDEDGFFSLTDPMNAAYLISKGLNPLQLIKDAGGPEAVVGALPLDFPAEYARLSLGEFFTLSEIPTLDSKQWATLYLQMKRMFYDIQMTCEIGKAEAALFEESSMLAPRYYGLSLLRAIHKMAAETQEAADPESAAPPVDRIVDWYERQRRAELRKIGRG